MWREMNWAYLTTLSFSPDISIDTDFAVELPPDLAMTVVQRRLLEILNLRHQCGSTILRSLYFFYRSERLQLTWIWCEYDPEDLPPMMKTGHLHMIEELMVDVYNLDLLELLEPLVAEGSLTSLCVVDHWA